MKDGKYYVASNNDVEFVIEVVGNEYILRRTNSLVWTENTRGKEFMRIKDTGNGLEFSKSIGSNPTYCEAGELHILLNFIYQVDDKTFQKYKFLKEL